MPIVTDWLRPNGLPTASTMLPISQPVAIAPGDRLGGLCIDAQDGQIGLAVDPPPGRMKRTTVAQADRYLLKIGRIAHHVAIRDDVVAGNLRARDDDARAGFFQDPAMGFRPCFRCGPRWASPRRRRGQARGWPRSKVNGRARRARLRDGGHRVAPERDRSTTTSSGPVQWRFPPTASARSIER